VLVDELSPAYLAPLGSMLAAVGAVLPDLADAFRTGAGVPYAAYPGAVQAQAALNRPAYACDLSAPDDATPRYDLALMFECLHDFSYPQRILATTRRQLADGGTLIVLDEHTDDELVAPTADPVQRLFANVSPLWCLPQGRMEPDADPVGTVIRPGRLRQLAVDAGFNHADVLPIEHPFFRFYRLSA
jgi:hypothetical protein